MEMEVVFEKEDGWYFWDETWAYSYGPYKTRQICSFRCRQYAVEALMGEGCFYKDVGCGHADTCQKNLDEYPSCGVRAYHEFLLENY